MHRYYLLSLYFRGFGLSIMETKHQWPKLVKVLFELHHPCGVIKESCRPGGSFVVSEPDYPGDVLESARGHQIYRFLRQEGDALALCSLRVDPGRPGGEWLLCLLQVFPGVEVGMRIHQVKHWFVSDTLHQFLHVILSLIRTLQESPQLLSFLLRSLDTGPPTEGGAGHGDSLGE